MFARVLNIGCALALLLSGCAIKTPARLQFTVPPPAQAPPIERLPGTGHSAVPLVVNTLQAGEGPAAPDTTAEGSLEFVGSDGKLKVWQHRTSERGTLFWRPEDDTTAFLFAWQPDTSRILSTKIARALRHTMSMGRLHPDDWPLDFEGGLEGYIDQLERGKVQLDHDGEYLGIRATLFPPAAGTSPQGLLYHMSGINGPWKKELRSIEKLQSRGWWVVNIRFPEFLDGQGLRRALAAARVGGKPTPPPDETRSEESEETSEEVAEAIVVPDAVYLAYESALAAFVTDLYLATSYLAFGEIADQVEGVVRDLGGPSRVLVGISYGAIAAPALLSKRRADFDSVVLIGGGANMYLAIENLGRVRKMLEWMMGSFEAETGADDDELSEAVYLAVCDLDPYHLAPALAGRRVLQVHAMFDAIVAAECGKLLYERLGRPERWEYPYGHILLLAFLPTGDIMRWIDKGLEQEPPVMFVEDESGETGEADEIRQPVTARPTHMVE